MFQVLFFFHTQQITYIEDCRIFDCLLCFEGYTYELQTYSLIFFPQFFPISFSCFEKIDLALVTQPMLQRRPNRTEFRPIDSYIQILCRFQKCKRKVPLTSLLNIENHPSDIVHKFFNTSWWSLTVNLFRSMKRCDEI